MCAVAERASVLMKPHLPTILDYVSTRGYLTMITSKTPLSVWPGAEVEEVNLTALVLYRGTTMWGGGNNTLQAALRGLHAPSVK